jgi:uncharacterized membrane protein
VTLGRLLLSLVFVLAGVMHFVFPEPYLRIMPPYLPWHYGLVLISGVAEILCGVALLFGRWRRIAAFAVIILLFAVFPANIYMAVAHVPFPGFMGNAWVQWLRLPLQFVLIAWAWQYAKPRP